MQAQGPAGRVVATLEKMALNDYLEQHECRYPRVLYELQELRFMPGAQGLCRFQTSVC
jgi:hypothetical protein